MGFATSSPSWKSPTNWIMFGFTNNNPGQPVVTMNVQYNIKRYKQGTFSPAGVIFYYSTDGSNWTHFGAGDVTPFTSPASTYLFTTQAEVTNRSVTITGLSISNASTFYLCWEFIISGSTGGPSTTEHILALDDFSISMTQGVPSIAGTSVWPGGTGDWATAGNWSGSVLPASGANLIFAGPGGDSANSLSAISTSGGGTVGSIIFSNTATGSYNLTGNAITISGGVSNETTFAQTLSLPLTLNHDNNFSADNGDLSFASITNAANQVTFAGNNNITVGGTISGVGALTMNGNGTLTLNGTNTYGGSTLFNSGTLQLGNASAIPSGSLLNILSGLTLNLNYPLSIGGLAGSGTIVMGNANCTITAHGGGFWTGYITGSGSFVMAGTGTETFNNTVNNPNDYSGGTILSNGVFVLSGSINSLSSIGTGPLVLAGGTFQTQNTRDTTFGVFSNDLVIVSSSIISDLPTTTGSGSQHYLPFSGSVTTSPSATLTIANIATGNFSNSVNLRLISDGFNFVSPIVFNNSSSAHPTNEICQLDCWNGIGTTQMFSAPISGPGALRRGNTTQGGGGVSILSGSNTYAPPAGSWITHGTYLQEGFIGFGSSSVTNGIGVITSGPVGTDDILVSMGSPYLGFFASGGAQIVANQLNFNGSTHVGDTNILIIGGNNNLTLSGPVDLGASLSKMLIVSNTAVTTFSGGMSNTAALVKAGPGTLVFSGDSSSRNNTTTILEGALLVNNTTGSGTGSGDVTVNAPGKLGGTGTIGGNVTVNAGAILTAGASMGTLTISGNLILSGDVAVEINKSLSPSNDLVVVSGAINNTGSGTINVSNLGPALAPGDKFKLFSQPVLNGAALTVTGGSSSWMNELAVDGSIEVASTGGGGIPSFPLGGINRLPGGNISLTATGAIGSTYKLWASTNVTLAPITSTWTLLSNGMVTVSPFNITDSTATNFNRRFYIFSAP